MVCASNARAKNIFFLRVRIFYIFSLYIVLCFYRLHRLHRLHTSVYAGFRKTGLKMAKIAVTDKTQYLCGMWRICDAFVTHIWIMWLTLQPSVYAGFRANTGFQKSFLQAWLLQVARYGKSETLTFTQSCILFKYDDPVRYDETPESFWYTIVKNL